MSAVKAAPVFDPRALAERFENAGRAAGFRVERFGHVTGNPGAIQVLNDRRLEAMGTLPASRACHPPEAGERGTGVSPVGLNDRSNSDLRLGYPLLALTKRTPGPRPRIYLSAGIHGDEPAPPLALLEMIEAGVFDERAMWFLCPLLNPIGFTLGTRENGGAVDLNRDYKELRSAEIAAHVSWLRRQPNFDLALCVHEDWESTGYYLYELNPLDRPSLAASMIEAAARVGPIDPNKTIDGREVSAPGIIRPVSDPLMRDTWPEAIYLRAHHTTLTYTLESPSALPLAQRIAAHRAAIETALQRS